MQDVKPAQPKISIMDLKTMVCPCGSEYFKEAIQMKEIPAVISQSGKTDWKPLGIIVCEKCSKPFEKPQEKPIITEVVVEDKK